MKSKTSELTPLQINWVVATLEDHDPYVRQFQERRPQLVWLDDFNTARFATDWAQGGPIIEREGISVIFHYNGAWTASNSNGKVCEEGVTSLIAAMRCFVASKLGDEVEVPDELA